MIATTFSQAEADELATAHPELTTAKLDITDPDDRRQVEQWQVDVLVNNAGLGQVGPLRSIPVERIRRVFETNVFETLAMSQAVIPQKPANPGPSSVLAAEPCGCRKKRPPRCSADVRTERQH